MARILPRTYYLGPWRWRSTCALAVGVFSCAFWASCGSGPPLRSISVRAASPIVPVGFTDQLTATGVFPDGTFADLTADVLWRSSNSGVASVSNDGNSVGLVYGVAAGTAEITASLSGVSGSTQLQVKN